MRIEVGLRELLSLKGKLAKETLVEGLKSVHVENKDKYIQILNKTRVWDIERQATILTSLNSYTALHQYLTSLNKKS